MTWTYSGDPSASRLDAVRYRIQDTNEDRPLLEDAEIEYELAEADNDVLQAALSCAEALVARGSHMVTKKISGEITINYSDLTGQYVQLVEILQTKIRKEDLSFILPSIKKVKDPDNYPIIFEPAEVTGSMWDNDNGRS
jgi:hypothetical protein